MARLIPVTFLTFLTILIFSPSSDGLVNPFLLLEMGDTATIRFQNMMYWFDKSQGDPDQVAEETLREVKRMANKMDELRGFFDQKIDSSAMKLNEANINNTKFTRALELIGEGNSVIDREYKKYFRFLNSTINSGTIEAYLEENRNQIGDLDGAIAKLYNVFNAERSDTKLLVDIVDYLNSFKNERCNQAKSSQQWLFYQFNNVILSEIRAYTVMTFQRTLNLNYGDKNRAQYFRDNLQHLRTEFSTRTQYYLKAFPVALDSVSREIRRCDPEIPVRGIDYFEFEKLYQSFLVNSDQINTPCPACESIKSHEGHLLKSPEENPGFEYKVHQKCNGQILNCEAIPPPPPRELKVCLRPEYERRRYDWFTDETDIYGTNRYNQNKNDNDCYGGSIETILKHQHIKSTSRMFALNQVRYCNYCLCTCAQTNDTTSEAIRTISLRRQRTNLAENRVAVGVRLVLKDNVVHIQLKEGKLIQEGNILAGSERWVPLEPMNLTSGYLVDHRDNRSKEMVENHDYAYIDKTDDTMILDDYMAKDDNVIIGAAFTRIENYYYGWKAIGFQIMMAPFNWTTGKIDDNLSTWVTPGKVERLNITDIRRFNQVESNLDDPLKSMHNLPIVENAIVKFTKSDLVKDAGQSVYPYFDSQEVITNPSFPLGGIGLFKKGVKGYGGFVAPKIYTAKITRDYVEYTLNNIVREGTYSSH